MSHVIRIGLLAAVLLASLPATGAAAPAADRGARRAELLGRQRQALISHATLATGRGSEALINPGDANWSDRFGPPGFENWVEKVGVYQNELVVAGGFAQYDGQTTRGIARRHDGAWQPIGGSLYSSDYTGGFIQAFQEFGGQLVVGGVFESIGGVAAQNVARWDGAAWSDMGALPMGAADFELFNGQLYVASGDGLYRWNGTAWSLILAGSFEDLVLFNTQLVVVGRCTISGNPAEAAAWNGTVWTILAHETDFALYCGEVFQGQLYVAGWFDTIDGVLARGIARWTGSSWQPLGSGVGTYNWIEDLEVHDNKLVAVGVLQTFYGSPAADIVAWDGASWSTVGGSPVNLTGEKWTQSALSWQGTLYLGGSFSSAGGSQAWGLTRWDGTSWSGLGSVQLDGVDNTVTVLEPWNGGLVAAGFFRVAGGTYCPDNLALYDGSSWSALPAPRSAGSQLLATGVFENDLILGGHFTQISGGAAFNIARWNGSQWSAIGAGLNNDVTAMTVYQNQLIAAGQFTASGSDPMLRIARWDGTAWHAMGAGFNSVPLSLCVVDGQLYAGGSFTQSGSASILRVAMWDGQAWQPVGSGFNSPVNALEVYGGQLVAGGYFSMAGSTAVNRVARWDGTAWLPLGSGVNMGITSLHSFGGILYAGKPPSSFLATNKQLDSGDQLLADAPGIVVAWDGTTWSALGSGSATGGGFPAGPSVSTIASFQNKVYIGGVIASIGGKSSSNIARWDAPALSGVPELNRLRPELAAWPNPARGAVALSLSLQREDSVTLDILDVQGRLVAHVMTQSLPAGQHRFSWNGRDAANRAQGPGVYLARLTSSSGSLTAKIVLTR